MASVKLREGESLESAIKRFKKKVDNEGVLKVWREKQYFVKPSMIKRIKKKDAIRKAQLKDKKLVKDY